MMLMEIKVLEIVMNVPLMIIVLNPVVNLLHNVHWKELLSLQSVYCELDTKCTMVPKQLVW